MTLLLTVYISSQKGKEIIEADIVAVLFPTFYMNLLKTILPTVLCAISLAGLFTEATAQNLGKRSKVSAAAAKASEGYLTAADGVRLFYRKVGPGKETIVYLHGGPGSNFRGQEEYVEPLARGRTLIMYDQRGSGLSDIVTDPKLLTATHHVRDLEELRKHFGLEKMSIVGLSWGSALAALYAAEHPARVERIVFVSPMAPRRVHLDERIAKLNSLRTAADIAHRREMQQQLPTANDTDTLKICREFSDSTFRLYFVDPTPEKLAHAARRCDIPPAAIRNRPVIEAAVLASLGTWDLRPTLQKLSMPTLVIEGDRTNVPLEATREFAAALPNSRLVLIPNAGHEFFVDQPKLFRQTVEHFMR